LAGRCLMQWNADIQCLHSEYNDIYDRSATNKQCNNTKTQKYIKIAVILLYYYLLLTSDQTLGYDKFHSSRITK